MITFVTSSVTRFSVEAPACVTIVPNAHYADSVPYFGAKFGTELRARSDRGKCSPTSCDWQQASARRIGCSYGRLLARSAGRISRLQLAFTQLLGYSPQELLGRDFSALFAQTEKIDGEIRSLLRRAILNANLRTQGTIAAGCSRDPRPAPVSGRVFRDASRDSRRDDLWWSRPLVPAIKVPASAASVQRRQLRHAGSDFAQDRRHRIHSGQPGDAQVHGLWSIASPATPKRF